MNSLNFHPRPSSTLPTLIEDISVQANGGSAIPEKNLVAIVVDGVSIKPIHLLDTEGENSLEGFLRCDLDDQLSVFNFSGVKNENRMFPIAEKFKNRIAYYGLNRQTKYLKLKLVEIDEEEREVLDFIASLFQGASSLASNVNPMISGASALLARITTIIKEFIDDDDQFDACLTLKDQLYDGGTLTVKVGNRENDQLVPEKTMVELTFRTVDLGKPESLNSDLDVCLSGVDVNLRHSNTDDSNRSARRMALRMRARAATTRRNLNRVRDNQVARANQLNGADSIRGIIYHHLRNLSIEARTTGSHFGLSSRVADPHARFILREAKLASVGKNVFLKSGDGINIPFSLQLAMTPDDIPVEDLFVLAKDIVKFANQNGTGIDLGANPELTAKLEESALGLLTSFLEESLILHNFEGIIRLLPGAPPNPPLEDPGVIYLYGNSTDGWRLPNDTITTSVSWRNRNIGSVSVALEVKARS